MSRIISLLALTAFFGYSSAGLYKYSKTDFFPEAYRVCNTPEHDQVLFNNLDKPSVEQAVCIIKFANKKESYFLPDGTYDIQKISKQFSESGYPVPEDLHTLANINIDTHPEMVVDRVFEWLAKHKEGVMAVFYA